MRLNDRTVTGASPKLPAGKNEAIFFDEDVAGFGLRVRQSGVRTWVFQYWLGERSRRMTLGRWPKLSARQARDLVDNLAAKVALGTDPQEAKFESRARADTFEEIKTLFLAAQATQLRPRSYSEIERYLTLHARPLHDLPVVKIDRRNVAEVLTAIAAERGPVAANRARSSISAMFNWAMGEGKAGENPAAFTNKIKETPRPRKLNENELREVWAALPNGDYGAIVKLLILTGQRRTEVGDLRWSEIDIERGTITLPSARTKNGLEHVIPMSEPVRRLIKTIPRTDGRDFVFGHGNGGFAGWSRCKKRLDVTVNGKRNKPIEPWTLHDLRRTAATMMANNVEIFPHIIEAALNHTSGHKAGVAGTYNRAKYEKEVCNALALWGKRVLKIVGEGVETNGDRSGRSP